MSPELVEIFRVRWQRLRVIGAPVQCWWTIASFAILFAFTTWQELLHES